MLTRMLTTAMNKAGYLWTRPTPDSPAKLGQGRGRQDERVDVRGGMSRVSRARRDTCSAPGKWSRSVPGQVGQ